MTTPEEYLALLQNRSTTGTPAQGRLVAKKGDSKVGKLVRLATSPVYNPPDIPFAPGFVNRGIEDALSPVGLLGVALAPVTGGGSLEAILAREAALSVGTGIAGRVASSLANQYEGPGAGVVHIAAPIAAAIATGRGGSQLLGAKKITSRIKELEAADALTDPNTLVDPVDKIAFYIRNAKQSTVANELLRGPERARRAGRVANILEQGGYSKESVATATRSLAGKLPNERFLAIADKLTPEELNGALQRISTAGLQPLERLNAATSLIDVVDSGAMPTQYEAKLLARVYGEDFVASILKHRTRPEIWREVAMDVVGLPRALRASMDMSAPLRQGILLIGRPKEFFGAMKPMFRAFGNENYAQKMISSLREDPYYKQAVDSGLELTDLSNITLAANPEEYFARLPSLIGNTALGAGVKASERAYTVYLNKLRFDYFKKAAQEWESMGPTAYNSKNLTDLASFLNLATGRGKLPKDLARISPIMNMALFAPKFTYSRFAAPGAFIKRTVDLVRKDPSTLANPAKLQELYNGDVVLKEMAHNFRNFMGLGLGALGVAKLAGLDIEYDPRSTNFGRVKIGNTKFDMWAGYQPLVRYMAQIITGERKTGIGQIAEAGRLDTATRLFRSKESPVLGLLHDIYSGQTFVGDEVSGGADITRQVANALTPLFVSDVIQGLSEEGVMGGVYTAPAFFGVGVQTYSSLRDRQNEVAKELYGKDSYRELTAAQQDAVNTDQRVILKEQQSEGRKNDYGTKHDEVVQERLDSEGKLYASLVTNRISAKDFADGIADIQKTAKAKDDAYQDAYGVKFPKTNTPLAKVLDGWYALYDKADVGGGVKDWGYYDQLEHQYLSGLTAEEKAFIEGRRKAVHNKNIEWFYKAKDYINNSKYYDTVDTAFLKHQNQVNRVVPGVKSVDDLTKAYQAAELKDPKLAKQIYTLLNKISADAGKKKEAMRKQDPKLDWALHDTGRATKLKTNHLTKSPFYDSITQ